MRLGKPSNAVSFVLTPKIAKDRITAHFKNKGMNVCTLLRPGQGERHHGLCAGGLEAGGADGQRGAAGDHVVHQDDPLVQKRVRAEVGVAHVGHPGVGLTQPGLGCGVAHLGQGGLDRQPGDLAHPQGQQLGLVVTSLAQPLSGQGNPGDQIHRFLPVVEQTLSHQGAEQPGVVLPVLELVAVHALTHSIPVPEGRQAGVAEVHRPVVPLCDPGEDALAAEAHPVLAPVQHPAAERAAVRVDQGEQQPEGADHIG